MRDIPIFIGDLVAFPVRSGSSLHMRIIIVDDFDDRNIYGFITGNSQTYGNQERSWTSCFDRCIVVGRSVIVG